jgi:hypothetical protein
MPLELISVRRSGASSFLSTRIAQRAQSPSVQKTNPGTLARSQMTTLLANDIM